MSLPDFLVIGAAKSGTVSLYHYLKQHPQIYMSPVNEANFFALDGLDLSAHFRGPGDREALRHASRLTLDDYQALFDAAPPGQRIGESSPLYLYSPHAPQRIKQHIPGAKLVAVLRRPSERAYSNYRHYRQAGIEPLPDFGRALAAEPERLAQCWGPWPFWHYRQVGFYGRQLARYYALFDRRQIWVCLYEDFAADPAGALQQIYTFLGVNPAFKPDVSVRHNISARPRLRSLHALMTRPNPLKDTVKRLMPDPLRRRLRAALHGWNLVAPPLDPEVRRQLDDDYRQDVRNLQALIERDLSPWLD